MIPEAPLPLLLDGTSLSSLGRAGGDTEVGELAALEAECLVLNRVESPEEEEQEDGAGDNVEDTVPDHLGCGGDDVGALGASPADRVGDQHEGEEARSLDVAAAEGTVGGEGGAQALDEERVPERSKNKLLEGLTCHEGTYQT